MKRTLCFLLAGLGIITGIAGCATPKTPDTPAETTTQPVETLPDLAEMDQLKVLLIGQSLGQDTVWYLHKVLKAEHPEKSFVVGNTYKSMALNQIRQCIEDNEAVFDYNKFTDAEHTLTKEVTIEMALKDEKWDIIIFNGATYNSTQEREYVDGDHAFMIDYIHKTAQPGFRLAYNCTWANPTDNALAGPGRMTPPAVVRERFVSEFGGSRNVYYKRLCDNFTRYIETNEAFDIVFHPGTAIQYASETHGVPECTAERKYDLYRDYVHLSDFGRLLVAYQLYAQIYGLETLEKVSVDLLPANMRATQYEKGFGDLEITQQHKDAIIASVNFALAHPLEAPEQTARPEAFLVLETAQ